MDQTSWNQFSICIPGQSYMYFALMVCVCVFVCHLVLLLQIVQIAPELMDLLCVDGCFLWTFLQLCFELGYGQLQCNRSTC